MSREPANGQLPLIEGSISVNGIEVPQANINMVRSSLDDIDVLALEPSLAHVATMLPKGYRVRTYQSGDEDSWLQIIRVAERFFIVDDNLFERQFEENFPALADRMFFLDSLAADGSWQSVGTATAWWKDEWVINTHSGDEPSNRGGWGQVHWVAILPEHQGKGLSRPLMTTVMNRLAFGHKRAMLETSTTRIWAVKLYLNLGFIPDAEGLKVPAIRTAWIQVQKILNHPSLAGLL